MNSMIPLMGRQPQINDPLETAGNAASLANLLQVNQMRQRQMDAEDAARAAQQQRMMLAKKAYDEALQAHAAMVEGEMNQRDEGPVEMSPGSTLPGSANSPINQGTPGAFPVQAESPTATGPGAYRMGQTPPKPVLSVDPEQQGGIVTKPINATGRMPLTDPKFHEIYAGILQNYGLSDIADQAMKHRGELLKEQDPQSEIGKLMKDMKRSGPLFEAMGKSAMWNKVKGNPPDGFAWDPETGNPKPIKEVQDFMIKLREKGAARNSVTVISKTEGKYGEALAVKQADKDIQLKDAADKAPEALARVAGLRKVLREGDVFTGTGAETKLAAAKAFSALGITINDKAIANTEQFVTDFATNTLDAIATSGLGTGNGFTGKDLEFLREAKGGKITFSRDNIEHMLKINESVHRTAQKKWADRYKTMPQEARDTLGIEAPAEPAAATQKPPEDAPAADLIEWYTK
jgi:hypothetical protein